MDNVSAITDMSRCQPGLSTSFSDQVDNRISKVDEQKGGKSTTHPGVSTHSTGGKQMNSIDKLIAHFIAIAIDTTYPYDVRRGAMDQAKGYKAAQEAQAK